MDLDFFMMVVLPWVLMAGGLINLILLFKDRFDADFSLSREWKFGIIATIVFIGVILAIVRVTGTMDVSPDDVYGKYIIDRSKFPGKQSDWQYNHYRFEITRLDSIFFYETEKDKIIKTYRGSVKVAPDGQLTISIYAPGRPIMDSRPKLVQKSFSFYYVFKTKLFGNVFFKKGTWKSI